MTILLRLVCTLIFVLGLLQSVLADTGSFTVVQICDPQLGMTDNRENVCSLEQIVKQVNLLNPDYAIICGDMVNTPNDVSISDFTRIRSAFSVQCLCVPGNHDIGGQAISTNSLAKYRKDIGEDYFSVRRQGVRLLVLDTPLLKWPVAGETEKQMQWLRSEFKAAQAGNEAVYVFVHIPPFMYRPDEPEGWHNLPPLRRAEVLDLFSKHGVRAVLAGHLHQVLDKKEGGVRYFAGETTSTNFDSRPPGFRLWQISGDSFTNTFIPLYRKKDMERGSSPVPGSETGSVAACRANLRFLDAAKEAVGMSGARPNGAAVSDEELSGWIRGGLPLSGVLPAAPTRSTPWARIQRVR